MINLKLNEPILDSGSGLPDDNFIGKVELNDDENICLDQESFVFYRHTIE